jgi:hypothetical protein
MTREREGSYIQYSQRDSEIFSRDRQEPKIFGFGSRLFWFRLVAIAGLGLSVFVGSDPAIACLGSHSSGERPRTEQAVSPVPPQVVERIRQDLAARTGQKGDRFQVQSATTQTWSDGCLGLAQPGELCTQALVEGWRVVMTFNQQQWVYRSNRQGTVFRAETP